MVRHTVAPAAFAATDANSYVWMPGAMRPVREVTLVGASHLSGMVGRTMTALEFRRTAGSDAFAGAVADLTVKLSISPRAPLEASTAFDANHGPGPVTVFQGAVAIPASPAQPGPAVGWSGSDVVRIPFQTAFQYQGGTLCVDVVGAPQTGQGSEWWMADAVWELVAGAVAQIGPGCGLYAGASGQWSWCDPHSLLPGAYARFWAEGPTNTFGVAIVGAEAAAPIPLGALGLPAPGCNVHLDPAGVMLTSIAFFQPAAVPAFAGAGGTAEFSFRIPNATWTFGTTLATQWLDLAQPATSNAIRWTIASTLPTLDMALVDGHPAEPRGNLTVHLAHVLRFEHTP